MMHMSSATLAIVVACGKSPGHSPRARNMLSRPNRSKNTLRDRILHALSGAPIPMAVENVRIKAGLKNWESTHALLLELLAEGIISGQKTTKPWVSGRDHT